MTLITTALAVYFAFLWLAAREREARLKYLPKPRTYNRRKTANRLRLLREDSQRMIEELNENAEAMTFVADKLEGRHSTLTETWN